MKHEVITQKEARPITVQHFIMAILSVWIAGCIIIGVFATYDEPEFVCDNCPEIYQPIVNDAVPSYDSP